MQWLVKPYAAGILSLKPDMLAQMAMSPSGSHVLEAFANRPLLKMDRKLTKRFKGQLATIAATAPGSYFIEKCLTKGVCSSNPALHPFQCITLSLKEWQSLSWQMNVSPSSV